MRTVAAELRAAGEMPAPAHFGLLTILSAQPRTLTDLATLQGVSLPTMSNSISAMARARLGAPDRRPRRRSARGDDRSDADRRAALERVGRCAEAHLSEVLAPLDPPVAAAAQARARRAAQVFREARRRRVTRRVASRTPANCANGRIYPRDLPRGARSETAVSTMTDRRRSGDAAHKACRRRIAGVIFSPRATYADVAARPRVLGAPGRRARRDRGRARSRSCPRRSASRRRSTTRCARWKSFGRTVSDAQYAQMERMAPYSRYFAARLPAGVHADRWRSIVAGAGLRRLQRGARRRRRPSSRSTPSSSHSGVILVVQTALRPAARLRARDRCRARRTSRSSFRSSTRARSSARLLGSIDLFLIWWMVSLADRFGRLIQAAHRADCDARLLVIYVTIGLIIAAIKTASSGA